MIIVNALNCHILQRKTFTIRCAMLLLQHIGSFETFALWGYVSYPVTWLHDLNCKHLCLCFASYKHIKTYHLLEHCTCNAKSLISVNFELIQSTGPNLSSNEASLQFELTEEGRQQWYILIQNWFWCILSSSHVRSKILQAALTYLIRIWCQQSTTFYNPTRWWYRCFVLITSESWKRDLGS